MLRAMLGTGADRAIRVDATDDALDGDLVARGLKALVEKEKPDLVLLGYQQAEQRVERGRPDARRVPRLAAGDVRRARSRARTTRRSSSAARSRAATAQVKVTLPAVVTRHSTRSCTRRACSRSTRPRRTTYADGVRFAALMAIMAAKKKPLAEMKLAELAPDAALKVHVRDRRAAAEARGRREGEGRDGARDQAEDGSEGDLMSRHSRRRRARTTERSGRPPLSAITFAKQVGRRRSPSSPSAPAPRARPRSSRRFGAREGPRRRRRRARATTSASASRRRSRAVAKDGGFGHGRRHRERVRQGPRAARRGEARRPGTRRTSTRVKVDGGKRLYRRPHVRGQRLRLAARSRRRSRSSACGRPSSRRPSRPAARARSRRAAKAPDDAGGGARRVPRSSRRPRASARTSARRASSSPAAAR